jgi:lipopolysaccharide/colanic/teichoic acid biosynthesis glycosyltransferase
MSERSASALLDHQSPLRRLRACVAREHPVRSPESGVSGRQGRRAAATALQRAVKRALDIVIATAGFVALAPLFAVITLLVVLESGRPVFYRANRVGLRGAPLRMLKFRKMAVDAAGGALTTRGDARLTRVGKILARSRLDELPQLWHVLRGQMSLVGPRPEDPCFVARYAGDYEAILSVRPGLTGWTQIAFAAEAKVLRPDDPLAHYVEEILPQKVALDRMYAAAPTLGRDARILWWTFVTVLLTQPVAVHRSTGAMRRRARPIPEATPMAVVVSDPRTTVAPTVAAMVAAPPEPPMGQV